MGLGLLMGLGRLLGLGRLMGLSRKMRLGRLKGLMSRHLVQGKEGVCEAAIDS